MISNILGIISISAFFLLILAIGLIAAWYKKYSSTGKHGSMVGSRDIGLLLGSFTMTATWVGGGYINGTAETVYTEGLIFTQAPICYSLSLLLGGIFFARKMREANFITMLDPLQNKLGKVMGVLLFFPALCGELFWSASILSALGGALQTILGFNHFISIFLAGCIATLYTCCGGLYSVAYTDIVQLAIIFVGLWLSVPFAITNEAVRPIAETAVGGWFGQLDFTKLSLWFDDAFLLVFGGIPWQAYFQRVLSCSSSKTARNLSFVAAVGCFLMSIPSVLIGAVAYSTDWNQTTYGLPSPDENRESAKILPLVLSHLTPRIICLVGLGAVSAAVMSSADSSILSVATMFTKNIYQNIIRPSARTKEIRRVLHLSTISAGLTAVILALTINIKSVYRLWYLSADLVFVILFPQLAAVLYTDPNTYGSFVAFIVGVVFRLAGGEPLFELKPFFTTPYWLPYKTCVMIASLTVLLGVSKLTKHIFVAGWLSPGYDFLGCNLSFGGSKYTNKKIDESIALNQIELLSLKNMEAEKDTQLEDAASK